MKNMVERLQIHNVSHSNWLHHNGYCCLKICVQSLTVIRQHLETITELRTIIQQLDILIECCRQIEHQWDCYIDRLEGRRNSRYRVATELTEERGHPRFNIQREQLIYLSSLGFTWTNIATLLGISCMSLYCRRAELNYSLIQYRC